MSRPISLSRTTRSGQPKGPHHALALSLSLSLAALLFLSGAATAQDAEITGVSVSEATVGTEFTITGSGFGTKPPKVFLIQDGVQVRGNSLKAAKPVSDTMVSVTVNKAIYGNYTIQLTPAGKGMEPVESTETIDIVLPRITGVDGPTTVMPNDETAVTVDQAGTKGVKVSVAGYKAKILSIEPVATEGDEVLSTISFRLPKKVPAGTWDVEVTNKVGGAMLPGALTVVGSSAKLGKPQLRLTAPAMPELKVNSKNIVVISSFDGPTTVMGASGGKSSQSLELILPFTLGDEQAPASFTGFPALIRVIDDLGREWESIDDSFEIVVGASRDGVVSGSFAGDLFPVEEGGDFLPVQGLFTYDGEFELPDGGGDTSRVLGKGEDAPGLVIQVLELSGNKGPTGNFKPGDVMSVRFRIVKTDGTTWHLDEMNSTRAIVSGPTFNYQRLIGQVSDIRTTSVDNGDGSYTYTFPTPIPETYLAPLNDTPDFDEDDGELTGQPLLDGTYTLGMYFYWSYEAGDESYREVGDTTIDFLIGTSVAAIEPREVVTEENCNACHSEMQFHGGTRTGTTLCLMCHTAGSEDRNVASAAGGTPGTTVEFSVMIHKIHNGAHLPSVNGVIADSLGVKDYTVPPKPYQVVGYGNSVHDYSGVEFPAWPNFSANMPKDTGYSMLGAATGQENAILSGITSCNICHGDPDGAGPLAAPAQGDNAYVNQRRNTCGSCHDDWVHDQPYTSNLMTMPPQIGDETCIQCHPMDGVPLAAVDAHLHPLLTPTFAQGINFDILSVDPVGVEGGGAILPGDKVSVTFTLADDMGLSVDPSALAGRSIMLVGPSSNESIVLPEQSLPAEVLTGAQPYTVNLPMPVYFEFIGDATAGADEFFTGRTPHWNLPGKDTTVLEQDGFGDGATLLMESVDNSKNYIDVLDSTGFLRNEYVLIDGGEMNQEYLQIQYVEGNRLWFSSTYTQGYAPGPQAEHEAGATVMEVTFTELTDGVEYMLTASTGAITESGGFVDGSPIVVSYTTDFVMPEVYPLALNDGPDLAERYGNWAGKSIVSGTYSVVMWGSQNLSLSLHGESNSYRESADGTRLDFLVGDATSIQPYDLITSIENCNACHVNIQFHGNNRGGFQSCFACHATAGSGDRPQYVAPGAPATDGVTVNFRQMIHKIHRGADLAKADTYSVNGFGSPANYPNNWSGHMYDHVTFPAMPDGVMDCARCHGDGNDAWEAPTNRQHPTQQGMPAQEWNISCGSCHDSDAEQAHMQAQSSPIDGAESCMICHGEGQTWDVESMHQVR